MAQNEPKFNTEDLKDRIAKHGGFVLPAITVAAVTIMMVAVLVYFKDIWSGVRAFASTLTPFALGGALAFLQLPIVRACEHGMKRVKGVKNHPKLMRTISIIVSSLIIVGVVVGFIGILVPQLIDSVKSLIDFANDTLSSPSDTLKAFIEKYDTLGLLQFDGEKYNLIWTDIAAILTKYTDIVVNNLMTVGSTIYHTFFSILVGFITAVYLLIDKERFAAQGKKICYALMKREKCESVIYWTRRANKIFAGFISGKIIDSLIIGVLCYLILLVFNFHYPLLIAVIIGVTNVIPFFGPFIGAVPSALILLFVSPAEGLWFILIVFLLQQLDGNVIGPLILGDSVGISAIWIMISIVVGSSLFGFTGMVLAVPVFALIYAFIKAFLEAKLKAKGLPMASDDYRGEIVTEQGAAESRKKPSSAERLRKAIRKRRGKK